MGRVGAARIRDIAIAGRIIHYHDAVAHVSGHLKLHGGHVGERFFCSSSKTRARKSRATAAGRRNIGIFPFWRISAPSIGPEDEWVGLTWLSGVIRPAVQHSLVQLA